MTKPAFYTITYGLSGCYMPDCNSGAVHFNTRRELATAIRNELDNFSMPACLFREVNITRLWQHIQRHGSSVAHFRLIHGDYELAFHGLTEAEYEADQAE